MTRLAAVALAIPLLTGCLRPHTRIVIPAQIINPDAPATAAPATYYSERDFALTVTTSTGATIELIGASSPVIRARGDAAVGIITASGKIITVTASEAVAP